MKRDAMELGQDALALFCEAGHGRLDMAFVDVSGEPRTWRGFVHREAVEAIPQQAGLFANEPSDYYSWLGQIRNVVPGKPTSAKLTSLNLTCPRCRTQGRPRGRTLRVTGRVLQELVIEHNLHEASLAFVDRYMKMRSVAG